MSGLSTQAVELYRRLRELWIGDFEAILDGIDPGLRAGRLGTRSLPRGVMVMRGAYSASARYRTGDLVTSAGAVYVAVAGSTGEAVTDTDFFIPIGGSGPSEALFWGGEMVLWGSDGLYWGT